MTLTVAKFKALTRFEQSLFGLPFILTAVALAFRQNPFYDKSYFSLLLIVPSFLAARTSGMAFNQLIDKEFDAKNPRTGSRPIPAKLVTPKQALNVALVSLALFLFFTFLIGPLTFLLSVLGAFLIVIYSYMKRIHYSCHLILGILHFLAPLTAYVAIIGRIDLSILLIGFISLCSITGVEIVYAMQDLNFDSQEKLKSVPTRFGIKKSLLIAKFLHAFCLTTILAFGFYQKMPPIFYGAFFAAAYSFYIFYKKWENETLFAFSCNVIVSSSLFIFTLFSILWRVLL